MQTHPLLAKSASHVTLTSPPSLSSSSSSSSSAEVSHALSFSLSLSPEDMDSTALLDSALFQLTPTRTRFDLVLFCGSKKEKLASGLFEPFISHLKFARDQISRGGYSISLRPPTTRSSWFTKSTFERFVRFVNTPAILERFAGLEKEISQIDNSIQANEIPDDISSDHLQDRSKTGGNGSLRKSNDASKKDFDESNEGVEEENSKIKLQRLLETRRTLLWREQAMAYARGVAAGFEIDSMDDLISFADTFGASRLWEACNNYKVLWKRKHGDGLWMAELAAIKACGPQDMPLLGSSGIILANEVASLSLNGTNSTPSNAGSENKDDKSTANSDQIPSAVPAFQAPMAWPNQIPQYFYPFQQPPPYQGYPYPPMQPMPWPPKGKSYKKKGSDSSEEDESSESDSTSDDSASSLEDQGKNHRTRTSTKNRKKLSKTVIIRNINYITPEGRHEDTEGNELIDSVSMKESVDVAVGQGSGDHDIIETQSNKNWNAFQNILMNEGDESLKLSSMDGREEQFTRRSSVLDEEPEGSYRKGDVSVDSSIVTQRGVDESVMLTGSLDMNYGEGAEKLVIKSGNREDWFVADHAGKLQGGDEHSLFDENCIAASEHCLNGRVDQSRKMEFVDDSFMIQSSLTNDDVYDSRWRPDISIDADLVNGNVNKQRESIDECEPNDLFMILERNPQVVEDSTAIDLGLEFSVGEANPRISNGSNHEEDKNISSSDKKHNGKNTEARLKADAKPRISGRSIVKNRAEMMSKTTKKPLAANRTMAQKNKFEKEEEMRKRIEDHLKERQKRIAERSAMAASRKISSHETRAVSIRERAR